MVSEQKQNEQTNKRGRGAPRTKSPKTISVSMLKRIDELAEAQAKDTLIAENIGMDPDTFKRHFADRCREKRAIGKGRVLQRQYAGCFARGKGAVTERVWFGKQHLEQTDKAEMDHTGTVEHRIVLFGQHTPDGGTDGAGASGQ